MIGEQVAPRKTYEEKFAERMAVRQAALGPLKEGTVFEHGPAKFVFMFVLGFVVIAHVVVLIAMMASGVR